MFLESHLFWWLISGGWLHSFSICSLQPWLLKTQSLEPLLAARCQDSSSPVLLCKGSTGWTAQLTKNVQDSATGQRPTSSLDSSLFSIHLLMWKHAIPLVTHGAGGTSQSECDSFMTGAINTPDMQEKNQRIYRLESTCLYSYFPQ